MASDTAKPAVMAVKYFPRRVLLVRSIFLPMEAEMDLAFSTILSICDGGVSAKESSLFDTFREMPRNGVPEIGVDFPLAPPPLSVANRFFGGRALDMGNAGCAKHFPLGRVVEARVKLKMSARWLHSPRRWRRVVPLVVMV